MAVPTVPGLVGTSSPATILSQSARKFSSYQHPTVEKALQAQSELPKRQDVILSAVVLVLALGFLVLSFSGHSAMELARSRAVVELLEVVGWQRVDEGLLILAVRTILGLLSLTYSASLYNFIKLYTTASTFTAPPPPPSAKPHPAPGGKAPLLSSGQLALLFPSAASESAKALANLSNTVRTVSETPAQASHLAASVLKKTKVVLHDAASSAAHRFGGSTSTGEGAPQTPVESKPSSPPAKPPLLAPLHPEIQRPTGGSSMALWGSDGKVLTDANQSAGALPGKASPAFGQSPFVRSPFSPAPFTQPATPPSQSPFTQTPKRGSEREKGFTSLQSEEDLDNFLADLDRRMETPKAQSPPFGASPESGQKLDAKFMLTGAPGSPGAFSPVGAGFSPGYFAQQSPQAGGLVGTGVYPQTPPAQSPIFGVPAGTTPSAVGSQQQAVGPQSSLYSPSPSPAPYAPSAPPLPVQSQQQSPISTAPGPSPYGATTPAYASPGGFQQPSFQIQQPQTPSPYSVGAAAYGSPAPSAYSPYNQTPGSTGQYPINPQGNAAYPMTPPSAYGQSSNLSATPGSPYGLSPYQAPSAISPFQGGQVAPASSPLPPSGRPFIRSSPSQPKPGVLPGVKADREMPGPMPPEVLQRRLKGLGFLPRDLDEWRDELRVWFAEKLLGPLVRKMDESPSKVQSATSSLNIALPVALAPLGTDSKAAEAAAAVTAASLAVQAPLSEEQVLKMLGEKLVEEKKKAMQPAPPAPTSMFGQAQAQQQGPSLPLIQACLDAVTENQRLRLLLRGELASNVLPLPTVQPAFTARRIRELAEGACVKRYDWSGGGDVIPGQQPWTAAANLPGDAHLLFYLFTTFLEFPGWSLHQEPITGPGHQGGFFFVGDLPKRLPEQFVAVLQAPLTAELRAAVRQPKATVVLVGKQSPAPVFYLLWEGKFQFVIQGRTAIWDTIALLTYRLKQSHGGAIRGVSLNSSTMDLLPSIQTPVT